MIARIQGFLRAVRAEMRKVTWSSRSEIIRSTIIVLVTIVVFSAIIGGLDVLFLEILKVFVG